MRHLFEEVRLKGLTLKNRLVRSATWEAVAAVAEAHRKACFRGEFFV